MKQIIKKYLSSLGKKGGDTTLKRHGVEHFKDIQKKSVESRKLKVKCVDDGEVLFESVEDKK